MKKILFLTALISFGIVSRSQVIAPQAKVISIKALTEYSPHFCDTCYTIETFGTTYRKSLLPIFGNTDDSARATRLFNLNGNNFTFTGNGNILHGGGISGSTAKLQIQAQSNFSPILSLSGKGVSNLSNSIYLGVHLSDTVTTSNGSSIPLRGLQLNRNLVFSQTGINLSDREGASINSNMRLFDSLTLLPQGNDLVYGLRAGLVFIKNANYTGRSIVRSGNSSVIDASTALLSSLELPHSGGGGGNYYLKGYYTGHTVYTYGNGTVNADTIENYIGVYSTGVQNARILKGYNFYATPISPYIDTIYGFYDNTAETFPNTGYNFFSGKTQIGLKANHVADSTLSVKGGLQFVTGRQAEGLYLVSDANGGADWKRGTATQTLTTFVNTLPVNGDGSSTTNAYQYTTPSNTLRSVGDIVRFTYNANTDSTAGHATLNVQFAGTTAASFTNSSGDWSIDAKYIYISGITTNANVKYEINLLNNGQTVSLVNGNIGGVNLTTTNIGQINVGVMPVGSTVTFNFGQVILYPAQ